MSSESIPSIDRIHQSLSNLPAVKAGLNAADQAYLSLVEEVLRDGVEKSDRTGVGTLSIFGTQRKYDLREGFPLLTTKKVKFEGILRELLWFLKGATNINDDLTKHTPIWDAWADSEGNLGPIYGYQWRKWEKFTWNEPAQKYEKSHIDQIQIALDTIKNNPDSRRIIVSGWNVADLDRMKLPPCHAFFQFYVVKGRLDLHLYQRSADMALGVPFNIASYATLLTMIAQESNLIPGVFVHTIGDTHIYLNHLEGLKKQLGRTGFALPTLQVAKKPFWDLRYEDFTLENYQHQPFIKFAVAV